MSRRLRSLLMRRYMEAGRPDPSGRVLGISDEAALRGALNAVCKAAGIRPTLPKHLRDTFASQLLSAGVPLAWISRALGHGNVGTTARHYAAQVEAQQYRNPLQVAEGETPPDLFVQLDSGHATTTPLYATKQ